MMNVKHFGLKMFVACSFIDWQTKNDEKRSSTFSLQTPENQ